MTLSDKKLDSLQHLQSAKLDVNRIRKNIIEALRLVDHLTFTRGKTASIPTESANTIKTNCDKLLEEIDGILLNIDNKYKALQKPKEKPYAG